MYKCTWGDLRLLAIDDNRGCVVVVGVVTDEIIMIDHLATDNCTVIALVVVVAWMAGEIAGRNINQLSLKHLKTITQESVL